MGIIITKHFFIFILIIFLITILIVLIYFIVNTKESDKEKNSIYECGFNPIMEIGSPFSIRFFIIAILFLVFDLEVIVLFLWAILIFESIYIHITAFLFISILTIGLIYEWINGGLEWD